MPLTIAVSTLGFSVAIATGTLLLWAVNIHIIPKVSLKIRQLSTRIFLEVLHGLELLKSKARNGLSKSILASSMSRVLVLSFYLLLYTARLGTLNKHVFSLPCFREHYPTIPFPIAWFELFYHSFRQIPGECHQIINSNCHQNKQTKEVNQMILNLLAFQDAEQLFSF